MSEYEIGRDLGELMARVKALEEKLSGCSCHGERDADIREPMLATEEDEKNLDEFEIAYDDPMAFQSAASCRNGMSRCQNGWCYICCSGRWQRLRHNGQYVSCPATGTFRCGQLYRLNCS